MDHHALPPTRTPSWRWLQAWNLVTARYCKSHQADARSIKLQASGSGWNVKFLTTSCYRRFFKWKESSSSSVQEVRRSCKQFRDAERGRARMSQSSIGQYMCKIWWRSFQSSRFSRSPLRFGANLRAIAGGVSKSFTEDREDFKRMAMNKRSPRTQDWIQSAQRQVKTLIDRKDAYNMQVLQDWNTFRWSRITLLSGPAAKLFRMKDHVFSDSTLCVGVSNPDPSNYWATCCWMFRLIVHRRSH